VVRDDASGDEVAAMVKKQLARSLTLLELLDRSLAIGAAVPATSLETYFWSRHILECRLFLDPGEGAPRVQDIEFYLAQARGPARPAQVAAFEEHLGRMKALEARLRPLAERRIISPFDFAKLEYARLEAEIWLAREKGRK
jgi:hypothetical protein